MTYFKDASFCRVLIGRVIVLCGLWGLVRLLGHGNSGSLRDAGGTYSVDVAVKPQIPAHFDSTLSLEDHILRAEQHVQRAQDCVYTIDGQTRPHREALALNKAQSILIKLHHKERKRNDES